MSRTRLRKIAILKIEIQETTRMRNQILKIKI